MKNVLLIIAPLMILGGSGYYYLLNSNMPDETKMPMPEISEKKISEVISVSTEKFKNLIEKNNSTAMLLDIRTPQEFAQGHLKGAALLDYYSPSFQKNLSMLEKSTPYYIYCRSGSRSGSTLKMMKNLGFESVYELDDGIIDWQRKGFEVVK